MYNEQCRIKEAQESLYEKLKKTIGYGRHVTQEDNEIFELIKQRNMKSREKLFGHKDYVWYLILKN